MIEFKTDALNLVNAIDKILGLSNNKEVFIGFTYDSFQDKTFFTIWIDYKYKELDATFPATFNIDRCYFFSRKHISRIKKKVDKLLKNKGASFLITISLREFSKRKYRPKWRFTRKDYLKVEHQL